uniref:Zinc finger protein 518A n=1 Tax=Callorhinchus milii TaxID=7868 RepID=A0A4W3JXD5_CALMI
MFVQYLGDKFTKVTFTPVSVNVSKDSQQKLKLKLENSKVVLSKLNMERDLFQNSLVSLNKKSSRRCQTARKSFRKELSCFKKGSVPQALGAMSKTSPEAAKNVLIKVLRFSCAKCKDNVEYNPKQLQKHYQELHAADLPVYPCELCTFTANDFQSLRQHRLQHRTPLLNCEVCNDGKMYTLQELRRHLNWKHCVNGHFRCEKCRFSTKDQGTFIQHIHRHDEIQYKCGKCEHVSYTKGEFQRHLVVHTGSFPFSCQYCSYGATRKDYIVKHLNAVHKELTENSNLKADLDSSQKGKGKNPVGLKLVLKRYNNGVSRKTQWRKKGLHAVATMDNAKRYFDTTNKCNSVRPQSPTTVDPILSDGILNTKDVGFENVGNRGQNPKVSTSFPQSKTASSSQISKNFHPGASVVMVNNKLSVPPNYSAQFMGFKVVDGKQHLVIKLVPATKQNSTLSNSPPQALSDSSTNLLQSSADTVEQIHLQKKDCNGLTGTNTLSVGSSMDLPSVKFDITANQPQVSTSINSSVILKTLRSSGHLPNTFAYLTKSQIDSSTDLQYVMGRQTSSEEKMACSDFHTSLQSSEKGTDLPLLHEYAKRSTSEHNCHYALLVKGDIPNTSVNSQPSTVAFQQRTELSETMNGDSTAECSNKLDYSGADSSSEKELQHDATGYEWAEMKDHNTRGYINEEMHHVDADNNFQVDAQMSPEMPRITSVFSLQTGHEMNCLPPEENQLILDALTNTSVFLGHENVCSESRILERQTGVNIPAHKTLLHSFSSKEDTPVSKCIDDGNKLQSISFVEQLNTLLKTHGDEIINKQLMKDAIRTSANGNNRSSVVPVTLLRPIRLAGLNKPILIQSLQKGSAVPSHLSKQSRLQLVSGGSVSELNTAVLQTVTDNSISQTKKRPGMILTFSKGTLGAVSNLVCGGNLQTPKVKRETPSSGSCVGQNTHSVVTSGSEISCAKSSSVPAVNSMPFKSTLFFKGPISALVDHCSYAKDTTASKETLENSIEKRSLEGCVDDADLLFQPCENVKSFVSSNSSSHSMSQERVLGCSSTPRNIKAETLPSQQTVVLQCLMQKKQTGPSSEDSPVNTSSTSDDTGPPQKKILLRIVKRSNEESSTKDGQYLKNALSTFQKDAAGNLIKPLQQPSPAVLLTTGGSHCFLLPVNKHFPSSAATWRFLPQGGVHTSLKLPIPRIPRTPSIRSTEKSTGKVYSFNTPKSATKSNCRSTKEKSDEVWTPRKASNEKLVFRYSKRLKRKLEHSEKSLKTVTIDYGTHKEKQKGELNKRVEFHNSAATARTVRTMRLIPFDHHQLIRCPRRNQPVIVLNHPDVDVPEVYNVMKTMKKYQGNVIKVVLSKRTIEALLNPTSSNVRVAAKGFPAIRHKKVKPVSPVKERYILKLKLKKTSKNNYQIVKTVSSKAIEAKFSCWFCGRIFDNQDDWVGHGQRHLMEATRDWNTLI